MAILINEKPAEIISKNEKLIRLKLDNSEVVNLKIMSKDGQKTAKLYQIRIVK